MNLKLSSGQVIHVNMDGYEGRARLLSRFVRSDYKYARKYNHAPRDLAKLIAIGELFKFPDIEVRSM